jgi:hypothetical protein
MMTQTRPTELHQRRILMIRRPAAAAEARRQVRAITRAWEIPVDPDIAVLLTSDLVTHAIVGWDSGTITLAVRCSRDQLRVDVYDTSLPLPMAVDEQASGQPRPGLALVASLSAEWGSFLTFTGKAMYFALAFGADSSHL